MASKPTHKEPEKVKLYRDKLDPSERCRYMDKLRLIDDIDPMEDVAVKSWPKNCEDILPNISQYDIIFYLMFNPSSYTKDQLKCLKGLDAYNQFVCGWVTDRRAYVCKDNKHIAVSAKVMHSQRLREKPLRPWVVAEKDGGIVCSHCDCQAGLGEVCSHVSALLFSIEAVARIRNERTVTDKPAYWKLPPEIRKLEYNRLCEIDMTSASNLKKKFENKVIPSLAPTIETPKPKQKVVLPPTQEEMNSFYEQLFNTRTKPVLLSTVEPYCNSFVPRIVSKEFPKVFCDIYNPKLLHSKKNQIIVHCESIKTSLSVTTEQARNVEMATRLQSKTKLWNKFRAGRVTASKARAALKTNLTSPAQSLIKSICYPEFSKFTNQATQWGLEHEATAKKEFSEEMSSFHENLSIEQCGFFIDPNHVWIGASPDGIVNCDCCGSSLIEIKCPYSVRNSGVYEQNLNYLVRNDEGRYYLNKDHPYYYQVQTQLGVTGKDLCFFVVWSTRDIHVERIIFDEELYSEICARTKILFDSVILPELVSKCFTAKSVLPVLQVSNTNQTTVVNQPPSPNNQQQVQQKQSATYASTQSQNITATDKWCFCGDEEYGKMIACDDENCKYQWFHLDCVGLKKTPRGKWFCTECRPLKRKCSKKQQITA